MKNTTCYVFVLLLTFLGSCDTNKITCIRVDANIISEVRELDGFDRVEFNHIGDLKLTQGPVFSFKITGPDNVLELTKTKIENGLLVIWMDDCFSGDFDLTVELTAPNYKMINLSGLGSITTAGPIESEVIEMGLIGSGDIEAEIYATELYTTITGTGEISYRGLVLSHQLSCSGEFTLNSYALETDHTSIDISGKGDSYVTVNKTLTVDIEGSGNVYYHGIPVIDSSIIGIGEIIDQN
jgi:hypothetical protein